MQGVDLGAIASSLLLTIGSLGEALERISSSASLQYSQLSRSSFQQVYIAFLGNRDLCHSFLRDCADYGKKVLVWCLASVASPTSSRVGRPSQDLRERTAGLRSEATGVSAENAASAQGLSSSVNAFDLCHLYTWAPLFIVHQGHEDLNLYTICSLLFVSGPRHVM